MGGSSHYINCLLFYMVCSSQWCAHSWDVRSLFSTIFGLCMYYAWVDLYSMCWMRLHPHKTEMVVERAKFSLFLHRQIVNPCTHKARCIPPQNFSSSATGTMHWRIYCYAQIYKRKTSLSVLIEFRHLKRPQRVILVLFSSIKKEYLNNFKKKEKKYLNRPHVEKELLK